MIEYVKHERQVNRAKPVITELIFREKSLDFAKQLGLNDFKCSRTFFNRFMARNGMSYRLPTHRAQQNLKSVSTKFQDTVYFLNKLNSTCNEYDPDYILNTDETPCYFDQQHKRTIDFIGNKSVEICNTGNEKSRFTAVITITASGIMLPVYILFKGLKKVPAIFKSSPVPETIVLAASMSGTIDQDLMVDYLERVVNPYTKGKKSLLILDEHKAHYTQTVQKCMVDMMIDSILYQVVTQVVYKL